MKKTDRLYLRITPDLKSRIETVSSQVGKKKSEFIERVLSKAVLDPSAFFQCCPECGVPMFDPEEIPITEGVSEMECSNGHSSEFDFETNEFI